MSVSVVVPACVLWSWCECVRLSAVSRGVLIRACGVSRVVGAVRLSAFGRGVLTRAGGVSRVVGACVSLCVCLPVGRGVRTRACVGVRGSCRCLCRVSPRRAPVPRQSRRWRGDCIGLTGKLGQTEQLLPVVILSA